MSPLLRSGLATNQERICSHSPSKGSLWVRRQPKTRFLRSCSQYKVSSPAVGPGTLHDATWIVLHKRLLELAAYCSKLSGQQSAPQANLQASGENFRRL